MHISFELHFKHPADFKVKYCFLSKEQGGRTTLPTQGYRPDFWYEHPDHLKNQLFIIRPEFENDEGQIISQSDIHVPKKGMARMWIAIPARRAYHKEKIKIGLKGYFMEGPRKVAECEVIEIIGLMTNPAIFKK